VCCSVLLCAEVAGPPDCPVSPLLLQCAANVLQMCSRCVASVLQRVVCTGVALTHSLCE